jgi:MFS family permease
MAIDQRTTKRAESNIKLFFIIRIFVKRVFFPLAAIYYVEVAGLSVQEVLLVASFYYLLGFIFEVPTGYFADKVSKVMSIRIGAFLNIIATLLYVFFPTKLGIFSGNFFEAIGYAFIAGAGEALIYDSLLSVNREKDYAKIVSKAQSSSLYVNAILVAIVPMTYAIDKRLPFLIGTFAYTFLIIAALYMKDIRSIKKEVINKKPLRLIFKQKGVIPFGILFGIIGALYYSQSDMNNLALVDFGVAPAYIGWIFAIASLFAAIVGHWIHRLKNIPVSSYVLLDGVMMTIPLLTAFSGSYLLMSIAVIINMAFWRYRKIIYQDHLLTMYNTDYRATLLSL